MNLKIPYGKESIELNIEDENVAEVVYPNDVVLGDEKETIFNAISNPVNSKSFSDFLSDAKDVLVIVNDATRPTPTSKILDIIHEKFHEKDIKFIVATGVHRAPTEDELEFIFGKHLQYIRDQIYIHDAKREEDMVFIGESKNGTQMYVNKLGVEADKIVIISSVEPHYFAGYTGGRKSFLPGIASYRTIEQNHKHALSPHAQALILEGNPVHEDMIDALRTIAGKETFSIQAVLDGEKRIYHCTSGDIHSSFLMAIEKAHEVYCVDIEEKAEIVVAIAGYPSDVDLYQSQKALDNGKLALKNGGILILVSECTSGIGEETYFNLLSSSETPQVALQRIEQGYKLGYHKAAKMAEIATWAEIWGVTGLQGKDMEQAFIKPWHDVQEALDRAIEKKGERAGILFLMDASLTVPKVMV
jgi:nickel-dependent lactate racemase